MHFKILALSALAAAVMAAPEKVEKRQTDVLVPVEGGLLATL